MDKYKRVFHQYWLTILVGIAGLSITLFLWQALGVQEQDQIRRIVANQATNTGIKIKGLIKPRVQAQERMARRWEIHRGTPKSEWEADANQYIAHQPDFQALGWVDPTFHVRWIVPLEGNEAAVDLNLAFEERRRVALETARDRGEVTITRPIDLVQGGKGFIVYSPLYLDDQFGGFISGVFRIETLLAPLLEERFEQGYSFAVFEGGAELYGRYESDQQNEIEWAQETTVEFEDLVWRVRVWPQAKLLAEVQSALPELVLLVGLLLTSMLAWTVYLRQSLTLRTRDVELINRELVTEATERKKVQDLLQESEERYRGIFEVAPASIILVDRQGKIVDINPHHITHISKGRVTKEDYLEDNLVTRPNIVAAGLSETYKQVLKGTAFSLDEVYFPITSGGTDAYLNVKGVPLLKEGQVIGAVTMHENVTERKRVETELNTYREHLEDIVQERTTELEQAVIEISDARDKIDAILYSVADGLIVTDLDDKVILVNPAAEALLEIQRDEMFGETISGSIQNSHLQQTIHNVINKRTNGLEVDVELENPDDLHKRILRTRTALIDGRQGQPLGTVTIIQDVTRLREVDHLKTELLTTAAHELRTPLTTIMGFSEILLTRKVDQARQERYLQMIQKQSTHLAALVEDLLNISRLEAKRTINLNLEPINIADLMEEVAMPFFETLKKHRMRIEWTEPLPSVSGDHFRLAQVGRNLLSNAIKYSPEGGTIAIYGREAADHIEVCIKDEGIGMTPKQMEKIFEPFYRADASNLAVDGLGIGLAISKLIIEYHGGEIWLESKRDIGTRAYFTLPLPDK